SALAFDLWRRHWKTFVGASNADAKAAARPIAEVVENRPRNSIYVEHRAPGEGEVRNPERATDALTRRFPAGSRSQPDFYPPHQRTNVDDVEVGKRATKISHKAGEEPRPVLPFERNLLVMDDD